MRKNKDSKWFLKYSVTFFMIAFIMYSLFLFYGKSFIALGNDSLTQHYNNLAYYGRWLREILSNFFVKHTYSIPEFDLSIGLGRNVPTSLNYEVLGEPFTILAVFFTPEKTETLYNLLVAARLYFAGIVFCWYCLYHKYHISQILPGAMIYVFSFYTVEAASGHSYFIMPLIYMPLIFLGIDKIYEEQKPLLFIFSCAIAAIDNFYFFYMLSIFMFLYGVIRYFEHDKEQIRILHTFKMLLKFLVYYILAVMIAAPIFLPSARVVLSNNRIGHGYNVGLFYELFYYIKLPLAFINASASHWTDLGYGVAGALAVALLFFKTRLKDRLGLKIAFLICALYDRHSGMRFSDNFKPYQTKTQLIFLEYSFET